MRPIFRIGLFACAALLMSVFAQAVRAQSADITIPAGTDFLYTTAPTGAMLPGIGFVPLVGNPVLPGGTDTEVIRLADADATTGAPIETQLLSLNLRGTGDFSNLFVTLDPAHLADDIGTMSFLAVPPIQPGTQIGGTITDLLTVFYQVTDAAGNVIATGVENFTSNGTWTAFLPAGANEVTDFQIVFDTHVDPVGNIHTVTSFPTPEPSSWIMLAIGGLGVPGYAGWRRRRTRQARVGQ